MEYLHFKIKQILTYLQNNSKWLAYVHNIYVLPFCFLALNQRIILELSMSTCGNPLNLKSSLRKNRIDSFLSMPCLLHCTITQSENHKHAMQLNLYYSHFRHPDLTFCLLAVIYSRSSQSIIDYDWRKKWQDTIFHISSSFMSNERIYTVSANIVTFK